MTTTVEAGLLRAADEDQVAYCVVNHRVIFTQDKDFPRINAMGIPHAGIAYSRQRTRTIGQIIEALVLMWELLEPNEMENRIEFL